MAVLDGAARRSSSTASSPWANAAISGFIVDPDRKKMSKSKGNVVTPAGLLEQHGSDAVRYWAASSRLGTDAAFDPQNPTQVKIGRRLAIKVLNAAKFILGVRRHVRMPPSPCPSTAACSPSSPRSSASATRAYDAYDHARALEVAETFFWTFCDDYLELVKERAYGEPSPEQASAVAALKTALSVLLRLFAPVIPFATEEAWRWSNEGSVHVAPWPTTDELAARGEAGVELLAAREPRAHRHPPREDRREGVAEDAGRERRDRRAGAGDRAAGVGGIRPAGRGAHRTAVVRRGERVRGARHRVRSTGGVGGNAMAHEIRMAGDDDFFGWLPLFEAYCEFYETDLDDAKALIVWTWIRDEHDPLEAALAVDDEGTPVGLAQFRVVPDTLQATRGIHLDDLYVAEDARGTGVGPGAHRVRPRPVA